MIKGIKFLFASAGIFVVIGFTSCRKNIKMAKVKGLVLNVITKKPVSNFRVALGVINSNKPQNSSGDTVYKINGMTYTKQDGSFEFEIRTRAEERFNYHIYEIQSSNYPIGQDYYLGNKKLLEFYNEIKNNNYNTLTKKAENEVILYTFQTTSLETSLINQTPFDNNDSITVWAKSDGFEDIINSRKGTLGTFIGTSVPIPSGFTTVHWKVFKDNITTEHSDTMTLNVNDGHSDTIEY